MKWNPIETAPKDGTKIILWSADGASTGWWENFEDDWVSATGACGWENYAQYLRDVTHWMPLPVGPDSL
jgi:hypothetical protein